MKHLSNGVKISNELYKFIEDVCLKQKRNTAQILESLIGIIKDFNGKNSALLQKRDEIQNQIDEFFQAEGKGASSSRVVAKLKEIGYIKDSGQNCLVETKAIDEEINPMAGPQLVVPADKVNMVLNASNARWGSFYNSLYASNIIAPEIKDDAERKVAVIEYTNNFLNKIISFENGKKWQDVAKFSFVKEEKKLIAETKNGDKVLLKDADKLIGVNFNESGNLVNFILQNNNLKIEIILDEKSAIKDVLLESALTYIIDLEDASISAPENKYESYRIIKGIVDGKLECDVRGQKRKMHLDTSYLDPKTLEKKILQRSSLPLVRDVGPHMILDENIIAIDGLEISEKIVDCFITSLIGMRYHVAPKMHGAEEVKYSVELWNAINKAQGLPQNANKIGIMNEELRMNAQLRDAVLAAKDIVFFTNTGFLDYTGSFIDLMMHKGAIAPYRDLPAKLYKTSYETHNVNVSLDLGVAQIGAGMWPAIGNMAGLLKSKEAQVKGLTDTGWSPFPNAAVIHAVAFHIFGDVRQMQADYKKKMQLVNIEDMFDFPAADIKNLDKKSIKENLDFAIHGLIAYAEPWVRRGVGCSGVKDLSDEALMEDRATARIKAAFVRNWLLHGVINEQDIVISIKDMAKFVDEQNKDTEGYKKLYDGALEKSDWQHAEETICAVYELVINPEGIKFSYVEPYFYPANRRENKNSRVA